MTRLTGPEVWLGLDLGTSSVKAALVDASGTLLARAREGVPLRAPGPLAAEQDPQDWWTATVRAVRACLDPGLGARISGVGLTGQKHALLPLDGQRHPLGPAVLWCDGRSVEEAREAERRVRDLGDRTGAPALPGYLVPKWLRLCRRHPDTAARTRHLCFAKDWLRLRLTGRLATDLTEASASQLWDPVRRAWSSDLGRAFEIPEGALPDALPSVDGAGLVTGEAARETGLPEGMPVVAGAGDNEAGAIACGALGPGVLAVVLGTSGTVIGRALAYGPVGGLVWGHHALREGVSVTGTVLAAGRAVDWFASVAFAGDVDALLRAAGAAPADDAPLFLPTLAGERSPVPDASATGAFQGLRPHHGPGHLARAVLEGVALSVGGVVHAIRRAGVEVDELRLTSGGADAPLLGRLIAASANAPAVTVAGRAGPARGAALLARLAGASDDALVEGAAVWADAGAAVAPSAAEVERMAARGARLETLRRALRGPAP